MASLIRISVRLWHGKLWQWHWSTCQLVQPGIGSTPLYCNMQGEARPLSRRGICFWPLLVLLSRISSWKVWAAILPFLFIPVCSSEVKISGNGTLKSQALLWAGFFIKIRSVTDVEPCAWMFPSSPTDDILWCHEECLHGGSDRCWLDPIPRSRCWLRAAHLQARVPLAAITLLHFPLNLNEHLEMPGADGMHRLLGSFLFWGMTSSSFPPSPFMFTQCFTLISPAHIYLPGRVIEQHPGSLQGFCRGLVMLSCEHRERQHV